MAPSETRLPTQTVLSAAELSDAPLSWPVLQHRLLASGPIADYVEDEVRTPDGDSITRQYLTHTGAVAVIALDEENRVALVRQYRHPIRHRLVEPPAGLLDVAEESYLAAIQRELAEEVGLAAEDWRVLVELFSTPGITSESIRVFLARDLRPAQAPEDFRREGEEADMDTVWADLDQLVEAVLAGRLHNPNVVAGTLAAWVARERGGFDQLRPADAPWPARGEMLAASDAERP